jgi:TM2 domain-containing membrane protein YozV
MGIQDKKTGVALFLSGLVFPGIGQFYIGRPVQGVLISGGTLGAIIVGLSRYIFSLQHIISQNQVILTDEVIALSAMTQAFDHGKVLIILSALATLGGWVYGIVDIIVAYLRTSSSHPI